MRNEKRRELVSELRETCRRILRSLRALESIKVAWLYFIALSQLTVANKSFVIYVLEGRKKNSLPKSLLRQFIERW